MAIEAFENGEVIETTDVIPQSTMQCFIEAVEERFKNPEYQKRFEEWKKKKLVNPA